VVEVVVDLQAVVVEQVQAAVVQVVVHLHLMEVVMLRLTQVVAAVEEVLLFRQQRVVALEDQV
jgi:hypothetical protein